MCLLLSNGHANAYDYAWGWAMDCLQAIYRAMAAEQLSSMMTMRYAMHAEKESWDDECRRLRAAMKGAPR